MRGQLNQWKQIRFAELKEESNSEGTVPELRCKGQFNWGEDRWHHFSKVCS